MKIVLDTNIYRKDFLLSSRKFEMLIDYISKTDTKIIVPQIVYQELEGLYARELKKHLNSIDNSRGGLSRLLIEETIPEIELNVEEVKLKYMEYFRSKLNLQNDDIIPYKNEYLPEIINRSIEGTRPSSINKKEFKDTIIWLTIIDVALGLADKTISFISANTKDFAGRDRNLHADLRSDAEAKGISVQYFSSLDDFLKEKAESIVFVSKEWILSALRTEALEEILVQDMERRGTVILENWLSRKDASFSELTTMNPVQTDLTGFYTYEMSDGSIRIEASFESEFEIEYRTAEEVEK